MFYLLPNERRKVSPRLQLNRLTRHLTNLVRCLVIRCLVIRYLMIRYLIVRYLMIDRVWHMRRDGAEPLETPPYRAQRHNTGPISDLFTTRGIVVLIIEAISAHLRQVITPFSQFGCATLQALGHIHKMKRENAAHKLQETT